MPAPSNPPLLRADKITKRFHQVVANDAVSFDVLPGEIHCLLGENGAGKSTLAECLYGFLRPDSGRIFFEEQLVDVSSPAEAIKLGIGMVHQHFVLVNNLSVLENVIVGTDSASFVLDLRQAEARLSELCGKYNLDLDLNASGGSGLTTRVYQINVTATSGGSAVELETQIARSEPSNSTY